MRIRDLWHSQNEKEWNNALESYWHNPSVKRNIALEKCMHGLDIENVKALGPRGWYEFLLYCYFPWKFTECRWLLSGMKRLKRYERESTLDGLAAIKDSLFDFDPSDVREGLKRAKRIHGLGWIAASGLLAVLFPERFGTSDQFVVKGLCEIETLPERQVVLAMVKVRKGKQVVEIDSLKKAALLVGIMRRKAEELNTLFGHDESDPERWTPRKIDMILFALREGKIEAKPSLRRATPNEIRGNVKANLRHLKLSVMTSAQINYAADRVVCAAERRVRNGGSQPSETGLDVNIRRKRKTGGCEVVKSVAAPSSSWRGHP